MLSLYEFLLKKKKKENLEFNSYCISMLTWIGSSKTASFNMKVRIRVFQKILQTGFFNSERFNSLLFLSYWFLQVLFRIEYPFSLIIYFSVYLSAGTKKKPLEQVLEKHPTMFWQY